MAGKRFNPNRAKRHRCYTVEEAAALFGAHPNTVRNWLRSGLAAIDDQHPILIRGADLRNFLANRRDASRTACPPGTLYCFRCRDPRRPALGMADFVENGMRAGSIVALCETCDAVMYRRARRNALDRVLPDVAIQFTGRPERMRECANLRANCEMDEDSTT